MSTTDSKESSKAAHAPRLNTPWAEGRTETWIEVIKRAIRSRDDSDIRRQLPITPELVLALIYDAQTEMLEALKTARHELDRLLDLTGDADAAPISEAVRIADAAIAKAEEGA